jgi:hypothetical protein
MTNGIDPRAQRWREMMRCRIAASRRAIANAKPEDRAELEYELSKDIAEMERGWSPPWNHEDFPG